MLIAVDPGEMCGLFAVHEDGSIMGCFEGPPFETCQYVLSKCNDIPGSVQVVVERFDITPQTVKHTRQMAASETIGALRFITQWKRQLFGLQSRSSRMRVPDQTLKDLGWYSITTGGHANDAARHAFIAYMKKYPNGDLAKLLLDKMSG